MRAGGLYRNSASLPVAVWRADTPWTRMRGLLGRSRLQPGQGLAIVPCNAIHTFGMGYALDVVFVGKGDRIVKLCRAVPRRRLAFAPSAGWVLELPAGEIDRLALMLGDELQWRAV